MEVALAFTALVLIFGTFAWFAWTQESHPLAPAPPEHELVIKTWREDRIPSDCLSLTCSLCGPVGIVHIYDNQAREVADPQALYQHEARTLIDRHWEVVGAARG